MFKQDKNGIVRVEGLKNILLAHDNKSLLEVGGNSDLEWAEFVVIEEEKIELPEPVKSVKSIKKAEVKKNDK